MKKLIFMLAAGLMAVTSCTDSFEPDITINHSYTNDYTALVNAVNDLSKSMSDRLDALNKMLEDKLASIKLSIDSNTGAISTQTTTLNSAISGLNTTMLNGFAALTSQQKTNGETIVTAINSVGDILTAKLDAQNQLLSATSETLASLLAAEQDQTAKVDSRFEALNTLLTSGLEKIQASIDAQTGELKLQTAAIGTQTTAITDQTTTVNTALSAIKGALDLQKGTLDEINNALDTINTSLVDGFAVLTTQISEDNDSIITALGAVNDNLVLLTAEVDENGNILKDTISTDLKAIQDAIILQINSDALATGIIADPADMQASGLYSRVSLSTAMALLLEDDLDAILSGEDGNGTNDLLSSLLEVQNWAIPATNVLYHSTDLDYSEAASWQTALSVTALDSPDEEETYVVSVGTNTGSNGEPLTIVQNWSKYSYALARVKSGYESSSFIYGIQAMDASSDGTYYSVYEDLNRGSAYNGVKFRVQNLTDDLQVVKAVIKTYATTPQD